MYEPQYEKDMGGSGFVMGLLCGTAIGAAVALMLAPKVGSEMRKTLYDSTTDLRRRAQDAYGQASEQMNHLVSKGKQAVDRGREAFNEARDSASGQAGDNGSTEFGQSRQGVADFNTGARSNPGV